MTFAARGLLVSLAFFAVIYCALSVGVALFWQAARRWAGIGAAKFPGLLFGLRISSFAISLVITLFLTFPSFWMMERHSLDEDGGTFVLAGCAVVILAAGVFRFLRDHLRTSRAVRAWGIRGEVASPGLARTQRAPMWSVEVPLRASAGAPALILVGLRRPRAMISDAALAALSEDELQVAMRHEVGHRRSWDNLKKILISATPFPGMNQLEKAWREAAELAADDAAVENRQEALDLAAALIKLSRCSKRPAEPALASGLMCGSLSITTRVERLLAWRNSSDRRRAWPWALSLVLALTFAIVTHYDASLALTHRLTELLVP